MGIPVNSSTILETRIKQGNFVVEIHAVELVRCLPTSLAAPMVLRCSFGVPYAIISLHSFSVKTFSKIRIGGNPVFLILVNSLNFVFVLK